MFLQFLPTSPRQYRDINVIYFPPKNLYSTLIHSFDFMFECGIVITNVTVYDIHNFHNTNFHTFIRAELYSQPIQVLTSRGSMLNSGSNWGIGISSSEMSNFGVDPAWKTSWKRFEWIIMIRHISIQRSMRSILNFHVWPIIFYKNSTLKAFWSNSIPEIKNETEFFYSRGCIGPTRDEPWRGEKLETTDLLGSHDSGGVSKLYRGNTWECILKRDEDASLKLYLSQIQIDGDPGDILLE